MNYLSHADEGLDKNYISIRKITEKNLEEWTKQQKMVGCLLEQNIK